MMKGLLAQSPNFTGRQTRTTLCGRGTTIPPSHSRPAENMWPFFAKRQLRSIGYQTRLPTESHINFSHGFYFKQLNLMLSIVTDVNCLFTLRHEKPLIKNRSTRWKSERRWRQAGTESA